MNNLEIKLLEHDVVRLIIRSGKGNPLTPQLLDELNEALDDLATKSPRALILDSDGAKIFSGGFALPIIADWSKNQIEAFLNRFSDILQKFLAFPAPSICVIEGHAIAGGFILSLATDLRIVGSGKQMFGLSEVNLGAAVPAGAQVLLAARTSSQHALRLSMTGRYIDPQQAKEIGFADYVSENPLQDGIDLATELAQKPSLGVNVTRQFRNAPIAKRILQADQAGMEDFLKSWFSPEAQQGIKALAAKLSRKKNG